MVQGRTFYLPYLCVGDGSFAAVPAHFFVAYLRGSESTLPAGCWDIGEVIKMKRVYFAVVTVLVLFGFAVGLMGCGGSGRRLVGAWENSDNDATWRVEFFSDGTFILQRLIARYAMRPTENGFVMEAADPDWGDARHGRWSADGNRLSLSGTWLEGLYTFSISGRALTLINDSRSAHPETWHRR